MKEIHLDITTTSFLYYIYTLTTVCRLLFKCISFGNDILMVMVISAYIPYECQHYKSEWKIKPRASIYVYMFIFHSFIHFINFLVFFSLWFLLACNFVFSVSWILCLLQHIHFEKEKSHQRICREIVCGDRSFYT